MRLLARPAGRVFRRTSYVRGFIRRSPATRALGSRRAGRAAAREAQSAARGRAGRECVLSAQAGRLSRAAGQASTSLRRCRKRRRKNCSPQPATSHSPPIARIRPIATSAAIKRPARAAGRSWCSIRPTTGSGGSIAGNTCSTRPSVTPSRPGTAGVFVRPVHRFLERVRRARGSRGAGDSRRRTQQPGAHRSDPQRRRHDAAVHADLRAATGRSGGRAQDQSGRTCRRENHRRRRAGRQRARHARTNRNGVGGARRSITAARPKSAPGDSPMRDGRGLHVNEAGVHRRVHVRRNGPAGPGRRACRT